VTDEVELLVVGLGVMGAAVAREAARRGHQTIGLEQFSSGHTRGSSHGRSRAHSLFYQAPYLDFAVRARESWLDIQQESDARLVYSCGMLVWDAPTAAEFTTTLAGFGAAGLPHVVLAPAEVARQFPLLALPPDSSACWMPEAGFLDADVCLASLVEQARAAGADLRFQQPVTHIDLDGDRPRVVTTAGDLLCQRLVVTPGPWAGDLLRDCGWPLAVTRQNVFNFSPARPERYLPDALPVLGDRITGEYSFPQHIPGIKVAQSALGPVTDPDQPQPAPSADESALLGSWLHRVLPEVAATPLGGTSCLYTVTPDRGFIVGRHPAHAGIVVGAGFSGHGFKFAPVIGQILAELALLDAPAPAFLSPTRFEQGATLPAIV